ncbi:hypothetical protein ACFQVA_16130 [Actinomadura keratinilytica]
MKIQERAGGGNNRASAPAQPGAGERLPTPPRERKRPSRPSPSCSSS